MSQKIEKIVKSLFIATENATMNEEIKQRKEASS